MKEQKQMTMYDFIEQPIKKPSTVVNKTVDKENAVIESRIRVCIVRR
ncbi:hypothetical protein [Lysinibacillus sp. RC79]